MTNVELQQIGNYAISQLVRGSSTSSFYLGKKPHSKKELLIKRLNVPLSTEQAREAFLMRAKQLKKLTDRAIVKIYDFGLDGEYGYLVMDPLPPQTLRQFIPPGKQLAPDKVLPLLSSLAGGLRSAHVSNVLHKNLCPDNLFAKSPHEFLLAEFSLSQPEHDLWLDDAAFAVPYMAPEQLQGKPTDASDQYALAVMAYEWLCGRRPYEVTQRELLLQQQQSAPLPEPRRLNASISPAAERVLLQALAYKPEERFLHIQALSDAYLHALMGGTLPKVSTKPSTPHSQPPAAVATELTSLSTTNGHSSPLAEVSNIVHATEALRAKVAAVPLEQQKGHEENDAFVEREDEVEAAETASSEPGALTSRLQRRVVADLQQGGILSQSLPGYEERPAQIEMAMLVARALSENVPAIIEAGTGTGKSLAYLVPIVRSGKVAIVSTANKALQEQLFYKDIPFVQKHIKDFEAALVKGVSNYVCLDRVEAERIGMYYHTKNAQFKRLLDILNGEESDFTGDFETLGFQLPPDIRGRIATDSDQCAWTKCSFFDDCYVRQMRENAERAQVIVVNHTLLLLDAAIGGFLLPARDVIVLDEAHHLEEEATRSFTTTVSPNQIQLLLAQKLLKTHSQLSLQAETERAAQQAWIELARVADPGFKGRVNLEEPLQPGLRLATLVTDLADSLRKQRPKDMTEKDEQLFDKLLKRTQNLAEALRTVFAVADKSRYVYYVESVTMPGQRGFQLQVSAAPLDVTLWLKERLFGQCPVICTSATLATVSPTRSEEKGPNFAYYRRRIGLDTPVLAETPDEASAAKTPRSKRGKAMFRPEDVLERILPLAFDYESNALLYLPRDLPEPTYGAGSDDYMKAIAREMYRLVKLSRGRAFLLFSSKRMLDRAYELMSPHLPYPLLKQGDMTRLELTRRFREEESAVLFGLKSFWEGVDIAGDTLSLVVIDKLPFDPPDDPVHEARVAQMKAAGENWFGTYVLPQAVLRLKQGLGRLLRTRDDRGVMAILDTRIHTKGYGRLVLDALPPARRTASIREVERFFEE
jgi:Rad3-related DNA helicase/serine/threonine protein kinase